MCLHSEKKDFPIGISDFKEMIDNNYYFVDKTRFIAHILDNQDTKVTLITRPRRFGKTLNLSMLKCFFSIDNADEHRYLFNNLEIEKLGTRYMNHFGSYPVILFSLKNITASNFGEFVDIIGERLSFLYNDYQYILESDMLCEQDRINFHNVCCRSHNLVDLEYSLKRLIKLLFQYFNKKVILLIDEYDTPIISSLEKKYYGQCIDFINLLFNSVLDDNHCLNFAVLTSINYVFSGYYNYNVNLESVLSNNFNDIFGFTEDEIKTMMEYYYVSKKFPELKILYDYYRFGENKIYNPCSVISYIKYKCTTPLLDY